MATVRDGIDCSTRITKSIADILVTKGYTFVARYLVPKTYAKWLSPEEAQIISTAGLDILSVYETTASRALSGKSGGTEDGKSALACAKAVGQPKGSAIYFAVDFDVTTAEQYVLIEAYLRAAQEALGSEYFVGVYAEYTVIESMANKKVCKYFWQTYAWSAGKRSLFANVYQYKNGQSLAGITVDFNNSFGNEGFWSLRKPLKALTKFTDVPVGHYSEQSIADMQALGIVSGKSETQFGFGETVKREDMVVLLNRLYKLLKGGEKK